MMIWHLDMLWNDHHNKSNSPHEVITILLTIFFKLYVTPLNNLYFGGKKVLQAILVGHSMVKLVWPQEEMLTRLGSSLLCSQIPERVSLHARQGHSTQHQVVRREKTEVSRFKQKVYRGFQGNEKQGRVNSFSSVQFSSFQSLSHVRLFATPWTAARQASLSFTNSRSSLRLMSIESVIPSSHLILCRLFSCPQSFPASESLQMSQLFASGGQNIGVSASASVLPMNTQGWSPSERAGWISSQSKGLSRVFSNTTVQKHQLFGTQLSSQSNSHIHTWPLEKP